MNIVLVHPEIPQNSGNIARLCAATENSLHFVEPLGFELSDKYLKRAGLDYWQFVDFSVHASWNDYLEHLETKPEGQLWFFTTKACNSYYQVQFSKNDSLIFGSESAGLPEELHREYAEQRLKIKIDQPGVRSLNLANAVAISVYEARRQFEQQVLS